MDLLKEYEYEKMKVKNNFRLKEKLYNELDDELTVLETYDNPCHTESGLHFYCGICERKCYQDTSSGLSFFKKVLLNHNKTIENKYKKYSRTDKNGNHWMKVCFKCKYNNKILGYCSCCDNYYLKNTNYLKNRCNNKPVMVMKYRYNFL